jgi:prephenate dehydratase
MNPTSPNPRVAFQGERGAFSEEAAVKLLGEQIELVPRPTFEAMFASIDEGAADFVLAPVENSLAGSVYRNYDLLLESKLTVGAEVVLPIAHNLIGPPGTTFEQVRTVQSHPVALAQCTRFLSRSATTPKGADKISLVAFLLHQPGALFQALEPIARRNISLSKIESRPLVGHPWEYCFYLDLLASPDTAETQAALAELSKRTREMRILGCYLSAPLPTNDQSR